MTALAIAISSHFKWIVNFKCFSLRKKNQTIESKTCHGQEPIALQWIFSSEYWLKHFESNWLGWKRLLCSLGNIPFVYVSVVLKSLPLILIAWMNPCYSKSPRNWIWIRAHRLHYGRIEHLLKWILLCCIRSKATILPLLITTQPVKASWSTSKMKQN